MGIDVSFLMVQYKDDNGRWHENILSRSPTTYGGIKTKVIDNRYGWIDFGGMSFCFDPCWPTLIVRGRLSEDDGKGYFEETLLG